MNAMNKIIDKMEKDQEFLKKQNIEFRTRSITAETKSAKLQQIITDSKILPRPAYLDEL